MFTVYYSNQLSVQKTLLLQILKVAPNTNPFEPETILVQSQGMAHWLQLQIANENGIAANFNFTFPNNFLWQQYRLLFPNLPKDNIFECDLVIWRLMRIIPRYLSHPSFSTLKSYLGETPDPIKLFQLAEKIAKLFDQYLVYRPNWLIEWENNRQKKVSEEIKKSTKQTLNSRQIENIELDVKWQAELWRLLLEDIKSDTDDDVVMASHRAYFKQQYFHKLDNLTENEKKILPKRIFIFGISSLPMAQLETLTKLSEYCHIHLFFTSPSQYYWGNIIEKKISDKIALKNNKMPLDNEQGNDLLAVWGKQGRDFYTALIEAEYHTIDPVYNDYVCENKTLLSYIKQSILDLDNQCLSDLAYLDLNKDHSIQLHSCHNPLREVEVLHNRLLALFNENSQLLPNDIIVMSPDIDKYAPYIQAVFSRYPKTDHRYIPFTLSDQKETEINPIIASFITLLGFKEDILSAETVLSLLDVNAVQEKFELSLLDIHILRHYIQKSGIRSGIKRNESDWNNYNSWENGLDRLLLGNSLKIENGLWQETIAFDESYGLTAELVGKLAVFVQALIDWKNITQQLHHFADWKIALNQLISSVYAENELSVQSLVQINQAIDDISQKIMQSQFNTKMSIDILQIALEKYFEQQRNSLNFLAGKVNFCTLLPMRAIPFNVVCLLGMNETDFPRQQNTNSFDLMQYAPLRGDRARRDDDRYLFLEALLSAKDVFYISYIGQSLIKDETYLPSIVVSQLLDFMKKNEIDVQKIISKQPMMPFSEKNFNPSEKSFLSYDDRWIFKGKIADNQSFLQPLENVFSGNEIELEELIGYIQNPIKFFFNHHLGISLNENAIKIEEAEIFSLSSLENYYFNEQLVLLKDDEITPFFEREKHKGLLPASVFSEISKEELKNEMKAIRLAISEYQFSSPKTVELTQNINSIKLTGQLNYLFGDKIILWRVGVLRDKDLIKMWIYHLLLCLNENEISLRFFYKDGDKAKYLTFTHLSQDEALAQLSIYIQDYIQSFNMLKWAIYQNLVSYFKNKDKSKTVLDLIEALIKDREGNYLARLLDQTMELDEVEIAQTTENWFSLMIDNFQIHDIGE